MKGKNSTLEDVYLKIVPRMSAEFRVIKRLTTTELRHVSRIACPPILRLFEPPSLPLAALFTMPPLLPIGPHKMVTVADCVDFLRQAIEVSEI